MDSLVVLAVALPLLMAFLLPTISRLSFGLSQLLAPLSVLAVLVMLVCQWNFYEQSFAINLGNFPAPQGISFYVDRLGLLFAIAVPAMALLMWPWYFSEDLDTAQKTRNLSLTLLLIAAAAGMSLSADLFNLYVFYELLAVASYGLIASGANGSAASSGLTGASHAAAYRYLMISAMGSVFALLGIAILYFLAGTLNLAHLAELRGNFANPAGLAAFVLILLGFGVKAELFPVNQWVPEAYAVCSRRLAGLLAGLVSKLAVLVIVKALILLFPSDEARQLLLLLGVAAVVLGELAALRAGDMLRMLSWSSIAQLGLVFVAFSLSGKAGMLAGLAIMLHHLVAKPALFLIAEKWGGSLLQLGGVARNSPWMAAAFVLIALSMIGVPPLPGFWAKFLLLSGLASEGVYWVMAVILLMTAVEANYLYRIITRIYQQPERPLVFPAHRFGDALSVFILAGGLILATVMLQPLSATLDSVATEAINTQTYITSILHPGASQ